MRKIIWILAAGLLASTGCKRKSETEQHATEVRKAQENVQEQKKDLREKQQDVEKANREGKDSEDVYNKGQETAQQGKELTDAERNLSLKRTELQTSVKSRLATIDSKLAQLEQRNDPVSKQLATDLKAKRDAVTKRSAAADSIAIANWDEYQKGIEDQLNTLDKDLNKALGEKDGKGTQPTDRTNPSAMPPEPTH